jgi:hypothetical protein
MNATASPSGRVSRPAKAAAEVGAILATLDKETQRTVINVLIMARTQERGLTMENLATRKRLPPSRIIYGEPG